MSLGTLVYDADCGFCTRSAGWLTRHADCGALPWQSLDLDEVGLTRTDVTTAAYWLDPDGAPVASGAEAISAALRTGSSAWALVGAAIWARPVRPVARRVYAAVARNRHRFPGGSAACRLD